MASVEFFYDCSSPWTYLAFTRIGDICDKAGAELIYKPVLVGGIFNAVNMELYETRANPHPVKGRYYVKDLRDWADYCGVKIGQPPVFPVRAVRPMRGAIFAAEQGKIVDYSYALFESYWGDLKDISQDDILTEVCDRVGLDADAFFAAIETDKVKDQLKANTQDVIDRGGFGSPTIYLDRDDMYFGNDRLPLLARKLGVDL